MKFLSSSTSIKGKRKNSNRDSSIGNHSPLAFDKCQREVTQRAGKGTAAGVAAEAPNNEAIGVTEEVVQAAPEMEVARVAVVLNKGLINKGAVTTPTAVVEAISSSPLRSDS